MSCRIYFKSISGLAADLVTVRGLVEDPPSASAAGEWDTAALVAATALEAHLLRDVMVAEDGVEFSVEAILRIGEAVTPADDFEFFGSMFEQGADRATAGAIPLLLLPQATQLREHADAQVDGEGSRCLTAARRLARGVADETRLHLARGLDPLWATPCAGDPCHHKQALELAIESMRDCAVGDWDNAAQRHRVRVISDPVEQRLAEVADDDLLIMRLDAAIRAIGAAVVAGGTCVDAEASALLPVLLEAQRRGLADPLGWREAIESWLPLVGGKSQCVDTLIMLLRTLPTSDQATTGLTWVSSILMANVDGVARRSYLLAEWLIELRAASESALERFQRGRTSLMRLWSPVSPALRHIPNSATLLRVGIFSTDCQESDLSLPAGDGGFDLRPMARCLKRGGHLVRALLVWEDQHRSHPTQT